MAMTIGRRLGAQAAVVLAVLLLSAPVAGASCAPPLPIEEAIDQAPVVFVGTATSLEHDGRLAAFSVDEVWKGEVGARVLVSGGPSPSELDGLGFGESVVTSVDRHFEEGLTYLVVPFGVEEGVYMDNACSVTQVYESSLDDFRPATAHPPVAAEVDGDVVAARIAVGVVALIAAGALGVTVVRQRSKSHLEGASSTPDR